MANLSLYLTERALRPFLPVSLVVILKTMHKNTRLIIEILLVLIIAVQSIFIYKILKINSGDNLAEVNQALDSMSCLNTLQPLLFFDDESDFDSLLNLAEYLAENGYETDRFVHQMLAKGYYANGEKEKSALMLQKAIDSKYLCDYIEPSLEVSKLMDTAIAHFQLSEIYKETGHITKSSHEYELAMQMARKAFKDNYREKVVQKIFEQNSFRNIKG